MKKIISLELILLLFFVFCSCGLTITETENGTDGKISTVSTAAEGVRREETEEPTESVGNCETKNNAEKPTEKTTEKPTEKPTEKVSSDYISTAESESRQTEAQPQSTEKKTEQVPVTEGTVTTNPTQPSDSKKTVSCTLEISCKSIFPNIKKLKESKAPFLPSNGIILNTTAFAVPTGSTAFDVIKQACSEGVCSDKCKYCEKNGIHLDYIYTPGYDSYYIRGIHQLYERDCGSQSGWMYSVNGIFPNYGCNKYEVKENDVIKFLYTCDLGEDLGADY